MGMGDVKVFQIGFNKCGTRSMFQLFRRSKIPSMHWSAGTVGHALRYNLVTGRRPFEGHEEYVFYSDLMGPRGQPVFEGHWYYRKFYEAYPGALFILNTRNEDRWITSRKRHGDFINRFKRFYGLTTEAEVETLWREMWHAHHAGVRAFFADKRDVFLELDIETQGGEELAAFVKPHYTLDPAHWGHVGKATEDAA